MVVRFSLLIALVAVAYAAVLFRLYDLQVIKGDYYVARANSEIVPTTFADQRGLVEFRDKDGDLLPAIMNKDFPMIYAVPNVIDDISEAAHALAPVLNLPVSDLMNILGKPSSSYQLIEKKVDPSVADQIEGMHLKGIYTDSETGRFYPLGEVGAQVLGFVGQTAASTIDAGQYGLEKFYNDSLSGQNASGKDAHETLQPGSDLHLTIDPNIEIQAQKILSDLVTNYRATSGSVIVEDPKTGKILAMDSIPTFDPNHYQDFPVSTFLNPAVQGVYEPGSVFKVITMAIGIDAGKITPETTYVDKGTLTINGRTISNYDYKIHGPYGTATMTNVIEHSINTGAVFAEKQIGRDIFTTYLHSFGLADPTGIDLPGELAGNLKQLNPKAKDIAYATASYGQGVAVTPIELITAMGAIANHGLMMRPYLDEDLGSKSIRQVVSPETADEVTKMMISAVDKANVAKIKGYTIAGKTGTAFIPDFAHGGYTNNVINTYVGFGPTSDPAFIALIKIDDPKDAPLAGTSVVPAFRDLAQFILNYYSAPPDRIND